MAQRFKPFIPDIDQELYNWLENFRVKLLEILEILGLIQRLGGAINGGGTTKNLAQGPFTPDIRIKAKNDSVNMVGISIGLAATPTTFIEPAITGGKVVGFGEEKTFLLSELGTGNYLNMTNPYTDAGSLQVSIANPQVLELNGNILKVQQSLLLTIQRRDDWMQQAQLKENLKEQVITDVLRGFIKNKIKGSDTYTTDIGKDLGIISEPIVVDHTTMQPDIKLVRSGDGIIVKWQKGGADSIRLEVNRGTGWLFLAVDTEPDYTDTFAMPVVPATWKYRGMYIIKDKAVGLLSKEVAISLP